jgi:putative redox protein
VEVSMKWDGGLKFSATGAWGRPLSVDAARESGGNEDGYKPTELLLWGVAGCTGIDIVRILEKKRQRLESLEIRVQAEQNGDYPKPFHTVRVHYVARGDVDETALAKAIELSESKYCIVSQTIQEPATVTTSFEIA